MPNKQGASPKVKNASRHTHRGEHPGDKKVNRAKRSGGGARIPHGETLFDGIRSDKLTKHAEHRPTTKKSVFNRGQLQKQQADRAYRSLNPDSGTFDARVLATFIREWLAASPDKTKGQTKTGLAIKAVLASLPAEQAKSRQVKDLLDKAVRAMRDAFEPIG
jgi:hypothetical protein